ncbi:Peptidylprolyl isomerase, FKBP-type (EC 5.2.1.8), partial [Pseudomonas sp. FG-3G]
ERRRTANHRPGAGRRQKRSQRRADHHPIPWHAGRRHRIRFVLQSRQTFSVRDWHRPGDQGLGRRPDGHEGWRQAQAVGAGESGLWRTVHGRSHQAGRQSDFRNRAAGSADPRRL